MSKFLTLEGLTYYHEKLQENFNAKSADKLSTPRSFSIKGGATASGVNFDGTGNVALNVTSLDATKLSGQVPIASIPPAALERLVIVADDTARLALTNSTVQNGDTVKVTATGKMYFVKDDSKLSTEDGYEQYTASAASSVAWTGVTGKPSTFTPSAHTHTKSEITDFPTLATVATSGKYSDLTGAPTSLPANGGNATTVNGHTVAADVPASAVFTDTHYTATNVVGATATATANAATTNGSTYMNLIENGTVRNSHLIKGSGATTVTSDANGAITISSTNTTYSAATTSASGLMSASDKSKLDAITASADSVSFTASLTSGTKVGTITINGTATDLYCQTNTNTTYAKGTYNTLGLIKPSKSYTAAATLTTAAASASTAPTIAAISTTSGRYYAVEMDSNGVPFVNVPWSNTTYSAATTSANGLMTSAMVTKLNGLATGATADSAITNEEIDTIFA